MTVITLPTQVSVKLFDSVEETNDLWVQADIDGNGVVDYKEFQLRIWKPTWSEPGDGDIKEGQERGHKVTEKYGRKKQATGFSVKNAVLFPPEVEKGRWPENYFLSDHA